MHKQPLTREYVGCRGERENEGVADGLGVLGRRVVEAAGAVAAHGGAAALVVEAGLAAGASVVRPGVLARVDHRGPVRVPPGLQALAVDRADHVRRRALGRQRLRHRRPRCARDRAGRRHRVWRVRGQA